MLPAHLIVSLEIPVAWGEQDLFGHVNNIVYFRYFESVRMHFLDRIGVLNSYKELGIGVILASTTCNFEKPVAWPQLLTIRTGCSLIGNTSFTMDYLITDEQGGIVATGANSKKLGPCNRSIKIARCAGEDNTYAKFLVRLEYSNSIEEMHADALEIPEVHDVIDVTEQILLTPGNGNFQAHGQVRREHGFNLPVAQIVLLKSMPVRLAVPQRRLQQRLQLAVERV